MYYLTILIGGPYFLVYKNFLETISFLTILPIWRITKTNDLEKTSKNMFLFPLTGLLIGLLTLPIIIISSVFFNEFLGAFLITIFLVILTGVHHTDALADFADGVMVKGNKEKKYQVMHDPRIGSAGTIAIIGYFIGMVTTIPAFTGVERLFTAILLSEIISKYSMVLQSYYCESAWIGYSSLFTKNMKSKKKIIISTIITIVLIAIISQYSIVGLQVFITGLIVCFVIIYISKRNFGGITGDVMGATNEIVRLCSLISIA